MIIQAFKRLLSKLTNKRERFLIIEFLPESVHFSLVYSDLENKEIELIKTKVLTNRDTKSLQKAFKSFGSRINQPIVIGLDSSLAATIYSSVPVVRDNPRDPIDDGDLDNLVSQAVWKFFDRQRAKIAAKMGVNDFDILLADIRIGTIKLDGHRVVNPVGFRARTVEVQLNQTFTTRSFLNDLKAFLPVGAVRFIAESGVVWSRLAARVCKDAPFFMAQLFRGQTVLFYGDEIRLAHEKSFRWGEENIITVLKNSLKVSASVSEAIIDRYLRSDTSPIFGKRIEGFLIQELRQWASAVDAAIGKSEARNLYVHSFFDLPKPVFSPGFRAHFRSSVKISPFNEEFISDHYQFKLKYKEGLDRHRGFATLVTLLEAILVPSDEKLSQMAKKRIRWLTPI